MSERLGRLLRVADTSEAWIGITPKRVPWSWISAAYYVLGQKTTRIPVLELDNQGCWADDSTVSMLTGENIGPFWSALEGGRRDLNGPIIFNVTVSDCRQQCNDLQIYNYYAVRQQKSSTTCFCGETFGYYGPGYDCGSPVSTSNTVYRINGAYSNWAPDQPSGDGCGYLSIAEKAWKVGDCFEPRSFICQFADMSRCDDVPKSSSAKMPRYFRLAGLCFGVVSDTKSMWQDARYTCLAYHGDLPVIMDESTNSLLLSVVSSDIWLALTDIAWVTPENIPLSVTFFDQNEMASTGPVKGVLKSPIGKCISVKQTGQWKLRSCAEQLAGIFCKSVPDRGKPQDLIEELMFNQIAIPIAIVVAYIALVTVLGGAICCFCRKYVLFYFASLSIPLFYPVCLIYIFLLFFCSTTYFPLFYPFPTIIDEHCLNTFLRVEAWLVF